MDEAVARRGLRRPADPLAASPPNLVRGGSRGSGKAHASSGEGDGASSARPGCDRARASPRAHAPAPLMTPFPIVVGCGRSGTTLVRAMLNAHPAFAVPDESYFPVWLGRERSRYEQPDGFATERFVADVLAHESFGRWGLDADSV